MADKKSAAARRKHGAPKAEAKRGKREKKAAPEPKKHLKAVGKAESPAAKVKRGEKDKAPKQAKKASKGDDEAEGDGQVIFRGPFAIDLLAQSARITTAMVILFSQRSSL